MIYINIFDKAGSFAENKDIARDIRLKEMVPVLGEGGGVCLDFHGVHAVTQSFIHALISDLLRKSGPEVLDRIEFKSCAQEVRKIIEIVVEYTQEGMGPGDF